MSKSTLDLSKISSKFDGVSAKVATVLRNVDMAEAYEVTQNATPKVGDLLLAKVISVGDKNTVQDRNGRPLEIHEGDRLLLGYGNRYAVEEYRALVPGDLKECHLVSGGGVAARITDQNTTMKEPTVIKPIGLMTTQSGKVMNTKDYAMNALDIELKSRPTTIIVMGTGMDAGKTTSAAALVKGMTRAGNNVGFGKMTGTGLSSDIHKPEDAGAMAICDFVDMGYPSTYKVPTNELVSILRGLSTNLAMHGTNVNIIEVADGVLQSDNQKLLKDPEFKSRIDGVLLAAPEGLSALTANRVLHEHGIAVLALSGLAMTAPLTIQEFEKSVPKQERPQFGAFTLEDLSKGGTAKKILNFINEQQAAPTAPNNQPENSKTTLET